jgi:hypothetical protein
MAMPALSAAALTFTGSMWLGSSIGNFHGVEAPFLELLEQADARGREGRGVEE